MIKAMRHRLVTGLSYYHVCPTIMFFDYSGSSVDSLRRILPGFLFPLLESLALY